MPKALKLRLIALFLYIFFRNRLLNDGIGLPFLLIFFSLAGISEGSQNTVFWLTIILEQIFLGPVVGVTIGYFRGYLIYFSSSKQLMNKSFENLSVLAFR